MNGASKMNTTEALTLAEREQLVDILHRHIGFYISEDAEGEVADWLADHVRARVAEALAPIEALAEEWEWAQDSPPAPWYVRDLRAALPTREPTP